MAAVFRESPAIQGIRHLFQTIAGPVEFSSLAVADNRRLQISGKKNRGAISGLQTAAPHTQESCFSGNLSPAISAKTMPG
jgi:hypothetical protein